LHKLDKCVFELVLLFNRYTTEEVDLFGVLEESLGVVSERYLAGLNKGGRIKV
jgi:hypothetical protein